MTPWTIHQLLEATQGQLVRGRPIGEAAGVSIDSRSLTPGQTFIAIRGLRHDGHRFLEEAAHHGASSLIVSQIVTPTNGSSSLPTILVDDTTEALADLARFHRRQHGRSVVAVTPPPPHPGQPPRGGAGEPAPFPPPPPRPPRRRRPRPRRQPPPKGVFGGDD